MKKHTKKKLSRKYIHKKHTLKGGFLNFFKKERGDKVEFDTPNDLYINHHKEYNPMKNYKKPYLKYDTETYNVPLPTSYENTPSTNVLKKNNGDIIAIRIGSSGPMYPYEKYSKDNSAKFTLMFNPKGISKDEFHSLNESLQLPRMLTQSEPVYILSHIRVGKKYSDVLGYRYEGDSILYYVKPFKTKPPYMYNTNNPSQFNVTYELLERAPIEIQAPYIKPGDSSITTSNFDAGLFYGYANIPFHKDIQQNIYEKIGPSNNPAANTGNYETIPGNVPSSEYESVYNPYGNNTSSSGYESVYNPYGDNENEVYQSLSQIDEIPIIVKRSSENYRQMGSLQKSNPNLYKEVYELYSLIDYLIEYMANFYKPTDMSMFQKIILNTLIREKIICKEDVIDQKFLSNSRSDQINDANKTAIAKLIIKIKEDKSIIIKQIKNDTNMNQYQRLILLKKLGLICHNMDNNNTNLKHNNAMILNTQKICKKQKQEIIAKHNFDNESIKTLLAEYLAELGRKGYYNEDDPCPTPSFNI